MRLPRYKRYIRSAVALVIVAIMLFPVYWMINGSFQAGGNTLSAHWFPSPFTVSAYVDAFQTQIGHIGTSLMIGIGTVIFTLVVACPAAYGLAKLHIPGTEVILLLLLVVQMIPGIILATALYSQYVSLHLLNTVAGLVLADSTNTIPFAILIIYSSMVSIPAGLLDAARADGANQWRVFLSIVIPVSRNAIISAALFSFLFAWGDFIFALTLTTSSDFEPITLGIFSFLGGNVSNWAPVMASAVLAMVPGLVFVIFAQRHINAGALGGAMK